MSQQEEEYADRPLTTGIAAPEYVLGEAAMKENQGKALSESGISQGKVMRFSSWNVINAIEQGYIKPGYSLVQYLQATWDGYPDDPPSPVCRCGKFVGQSEGNWARHVSSSPEGKHGRRPIKRFELVNVWGIQGAKKSTLIAQIILYLHGAYNKSLSKEEFERICDYCQKITITNTKELIEVGRELKKAGDSYDVLYLDDINSIIPKQLAWKDREAYEAVFEAIGMIRRNVRVIITSEPNIEMVIQAFNRVMTFEVIVFPASKFKVERMCHDIHPYYWAKDKVTKIVVQEGRFNPYDTPNYFWKKYEERTNSQGQEGWQRSLDKLQAYEEGADGTSQMAEASKKLVAHSITVDEIGRIMKEVDIKGGGEKRRLAAEKIKTQMFKRLNVPEADAQ